MRSVMLKQLWGHKRRLLSTLLAVAIGVSFLTGTLVLGDTMRSSFDELFANVNGGTDVVVRPQKPEGVGGNEADSGAFVTPLDEGLTARVAAVDGVIEAQPLIEGYGKIVGKDGKPVGTFGPPNVAVNWTEGVTNPFRIAEGRAPAADDEVVINQAALTTGQLRVGDTTVIQTPEPVSVTIVGAAMFGSSESAGGSTFVGFTFAGAQRHVLKQTGVITAVNVVAAEGVSQEDLSARVQAVLPERVEAVTGAAVAAEQIQAINSDFLDFFTTFLNIFAGVALLVATISIHNTFTIIVAQRSRESALLRALGASRRQVLTATLTEMLGVGVVASVVGLVAGLGFAAGLRSLFSVLGFGLPATELVLHSRTIVIALAVGTVVTVLAGVMPARRGSRVAPLAALREVAIDRSSASRPRLILGSLATAAGGALVLISALGGGEGVVPRAGLGAVVGLIGVVALGPVLSTRAARAIGWPLTLSGRPTGRMARQNAVRNPRRTAGAATALMIGIAVVTLFTVTAQSLKVSVQDTLEESFGGDLVVNMGENGGFATSLAPAIGELPEVTDSVGFGFGPVLMDGKSQGVQVTEIAALARIVDLEMVEGSMAGLADNQLAIAKDKATERNWKVGSTVPVTFVDGAVEPFTVGAVYEPSAVLSSVLMNRAAWAPHAIQDRDFAVLVRLADGVSIAEGRTAVEVLTKPIAGIEVQDREQYVASVGAQINQTLVLVYVMLVLAIVIALLGIANTLALSIHERTRELGLLRAVGQTRRQVRAMVRGESVIIALFGTLSGVGLGLFLGWALVKAAASEGIGTFSAAPVQLLMVVVVGGLAGVVAALRPARSAGRLDVLKAIATD